MECWSKSRGYNLFRRDNPPQMGCPAACGTPPTLPPTTTHITHPPCPTQTRNRPPLASPPHTPTCPPSPTHTCRSITSCCDSAAMSRVDQEQLAGAEVALAVGGQAGLGGGGGRQHSAGYCGQAMGGSKFRAGMHHRIPCVTCVLVGPRQVKHDQRGNQPVNGNHPFPSGAASRPSSVGRNSACRGH